MGLSQNMRSIQIEQFREIQIGLIDGGKGGGGERNDMKGKIGVGQKKGMYVFLYKAKMDISDIYIFSL